VSYLFKVVFFTEINFMFDCNFSLHQSRTASELLIPKDAMVTSELETAELGGLFSSGIFSCPVVFRTSFELFHRCATNPAQVARKLEASVLHSFAVSNRRNCFVYKDETGAHSF